jgi:UPF0716 protein FxsA
MPIANIKLSTRIKLALAVWCVCEMIAFSLVVHWIGVTDAILLGVITSLLGFSMLRRAGASALMKLRTRMETRQPASGPRLLDETLATVGAAALLLPGFLSDIVGLALAVPALRDAITAWIGRGGLGGMRAGGRRPQHGPPTIDLSPEEWHKADPASRSVPKV